MDNPIIATVGEVVKPEEDVRPALYLIIWHDPDDEDQPWHSTCLNIEPDTVLGSRTVRLRHWPVTIPSAAEVERAEKRAGLIDELIGWVRIEHGSDPASNKVLRKVVGQIDALDAEAAAEKKETTNGSGNG